MRRLNHNSCRFYDHLCPTSTGTSWGLVGAGARGPWLGRRQRLLRVLAELRADLRPVRDRGLFPDPADSGLAPSPAGCLVMRRAGPVRRRMNGKRASELKELSVAIEPPLRPLMHASHCWIMSFPVCAALLPPLATPSTSWAVMPRLPSSGSVTRHSSSCTRSAWPQRWRCSSSPSRRREMLSRGKINSASECQAKAQVGGY